MQYTVHPKDQRIIRLLRIAPAGAAVVAVVFAAAILVDWALPGDTSRMVQPGGFAILPWAAVCFILVGTSLWLQRKQESAPSTEKVALGLAAIAGLFALLFLSEWVFSADLGIDRLLFSDLVSRPDHLHPGRIANNSAAIFLFEAVGLLLLSHDRRKHRYKAQMFAYAGLLVSTIAMAGYLFQVPDLYAMYPRNGMALFTALLHMLLCIGILMAHTDRGLPAILVDEGAAGILARRIMPPAVVIPLMFGWLRLHGEAEGYFSTRFGVSLYAVADMIAMLALVGWSARVVRLTDVSRNQLLILEQDARAGAELLRSEAEHARAEAERANNAKSEFLAIMSHELRTPLTAIIGYEELLSDGITGPVNAAQKGQLGRIKASAGHLLELIDQILGFARADVGREKISVQEVRLTEMLRSAASFVEPMAATKKISLTIKLPDEEIVIRTDPGKVMQIVVNLLGNAVKFTDRGGVTLRAESRNDAVIVDVIDTGLGIAPEHIEQVFEPFWQVEQAITRRTGGTGLGLSVSRRLAQMLGGDVTINSTVGEGSRFTLILPLEPKPQNA
ncbi:MAG: HAMP domain-containing histidine kinase [Gemmatimonadaceae bacterium]|nr:HAMP domain-containing histidine kinase [Gemmatimonadaceae bacterium]